MCVILNVISIGHTQLILISSFMENQLSILSLETHDPSAYNVNAKINLAVLYNSLFVSVDLLFF